MVIQSIVSDVPNILQRENFAEQGQQLFESYPVARVGAQVVAQHPMRRVVLLVVTALLLADETRCSWGAYTCDVRSGRGRGVRIP